MITIQMYCFNRALMIRKINVIVFNEYILTKHIDKHDNTREECYFSHCHKMVLTNIFPFSIFVG